MTRHRVGGFALASLALVAACRIITGTGDLVITGSDESSVATSTGGSSSVTSSGGAGGIGGMTTTSTTTSGMGGMTTTSSSGGGSGGKLDPKLSVPPPGGTPCTDPGTENGCPNIEVCRISGPNSATCEGCGPCGNLNAACTKTSQCDILFECYAGHCVNFCHLGSPECGAASCIDVGYPNIGVCPPM